jgi:hypothetical protein
MTTTVTTNALIRRINRKLAKTEQRLVTARGRTRANLGAYYVLDLYSGNINEKTWWPHDTATLEKFGRELGVLQACESLASS